MKQRTDFRELTFTEDMIYCDLPIKVMRKNMLDFTINQHMSEFAANKIYSFFLSI